MRRWLLTLLIPLAVLAGTGAACAALIANERDDTRAARERAAAKAGTAITDRMTTTVTQLSTTAGLFAASRDVTAREFQRFARILLAQPTIDTVAYAPRVPARDRREFERRTGLPIVDDVGNGPRPSPPRPVYYPYEFLGTPPERPRRDTPDAGAEATRAAALARAATTGQAQTTASVKTFDERVPALLVYAPIYGQATPPQGLAARRATLRGYAAGIVPLGRVVPANIARSVQLIENGSRIAGARRLGHAQPASVTLAGRRFGIRVDTGIEPSYALPIAVALGGLLAALAMAALIVILGRREEYAQTLVSERLAQQHKAEAALADSERRLRVLAETATDWVALVDNGGRYSYSSPSVEKSAGPRAR